ncbi:MAG: nitrite reductase [Acidobacteria bacterium]|nr:nitrite reductase [Acidobacteriota bacterium]
MKQLLRRWWSSRTGKIATTALAVGLLGWVFYRFGYPVLFEKYTGVVNVELTYDSSKRLSDTEFEGVAQELTYQARLQRAQALTEDETNEFTRKLKIEMLMNTLSFHRQAGYPHIKYFRDAGIRQYEGPKTCLQCHATMTVPAPDGRVRRVDPLEDVVDSVHFKFQRTASGFTTYGYDGREVNAEGSRPIPVGKIDRACGIPGSFSWTGWATLVKSKPESKHGETVLRSEGCGQCHVGGGYHPATEKMMPIGDVPGEVKQGVDCLICHSQTYDMNYKYVIQDQYGFRWNQDRTLRAAMTVGRPTNDNCLNCHQHNMGGDIYKHNVSAQSLGYENQRILHAGAKRANPFSPEHDVHARAGIQCLDCHTPQGHKIPRGTKGTDLVANDLPGVEVSCERCHTTAPHTKTAGRVILNGHVARLACETCHIKDLQEFNVVLRDWVNPTWNAEEGLWEPTDVYRTGQVGKGFTFLWFNGNGTFLANALGTNPVNPDGYNPFVEQLVKLDPQEMRRVLTPVLQELAKQHPIDVEQYLREVTDAASVLPPITMERRRRVIEEKLRPLMRKGESKIYPFKLFNAQMYEDMTNQGPFGAMILPFDYATYYETGKPLEATKVAVSHPIIRRMYELPFKAYMMDEFMYYFGVDGWKNVYPLQDGKLVNVEPHWMRQMGTLMINHGIQKQGRDCVECHSKNGIMDFTKLGYPPERVRDLQNLPELKYFERVKPR